MSNSPGLHRLGSDKTPLTLSLRFRLDLTATFGAQTSASPNELCFCYARTYLILKSLNRPISYLVCTVFTSGMNLNIIF